MLLTFGAGCFLVRGCSAHCRICCSFPGHCVPVTPPAVMTKMSPNITRCPLGGKTATAETHSLQVSVSLSCCNQARQPGPETAGACPLVALEAAVLIKVWAGRPPSEGAGGESFLPLAAPVVPGVLGSWPHPSASVLVCSSSSLPGRRLFIGSGATESTVTSF